MLLKKLLPFIASSILLLGVAISGQAQAESEVEDWFEDLLGITDNYTVVLDLKTNFLPGVEFNRVKISVDGGNIQIKNLDASANTLEGVRVAEYSLRENTTYRFRIELLQPDGRTLEGGTRQLSFSLGEAASATIVTISRPSAPPPDATAHESGTPPEVVSPLLLAPYANDLRIYIPPEPVGGGPVDAGRSGTPAGAGDTAHPGRDAGISGATSGDGSGTTTDNGSQLADQKLAEQNAQGNGLSQGFSGGGPSCSMQASPKNTSLDWLILFLMAGPFAFKRKIRI